MTRTTLFEFSTPWFLLSRQPFILLRSVRTAVFVSFFGRGVVTESVMFFGGVEIPGMEHNVPRKCEIYLFLHRSYCKSSSQERGGFPKSPLFQVLCICFFKRVENSSSSDPGAPVSYIIFHLISAVMLYSGTESR